ncbi:hypothetical protein ACFY36_51605 [Actinoplanes sp. NPDC000266]
MTLMLVMRVKLGHDFVRLEARGALAIFQTKRPELRRVRLRFRSASTPDCALKM